MVLFRSLLYLSRVHGMKLISVEVNVEAHVFTSLQDGASRAEVKHSLLAEHVYVVHAESPSRHLLFQTWQLNTQDVLCGFSNRLSSE